MLKKWKTMAAAVLALGSAIVLADDISISDGKSIRFGKGQSVTTNWSTRHSNPLDNTYQETVRVLPVCVNGRSFVVTLGMAGIWDTSGNGGAGGSAGAGGGSGIVQVFDTDTDGKMAAVACK